MTVRCIGKFTIAVGNDNYKEMIDSMNKIFNELDDLGIKCKLYLKRRLIVTGKVLIRFIFKRHHSAYNRNIYGVKCNGCYGFNTEETYNITNGNNKCAGYDLIEYILKKNK